MTHKQVANIHEKIETFLRSSIDTKNLYIKKISPKELLTWNRFDLAFKLFYLDIRNKNSRLGKVIKCDWRIQSWKNFSFGRRNWGWKDYVFAKPCSLSNSDNAGFIHQHGDEYF